MPRLRSAIALMAVWSLEGVAAAAELPPGLDSPDRGVVCHQTRGVCYDRFGPSVGLTEAFLGRSAAERLMAALRQAPRSAGPGVGFSPADGVECLGGTGSCQVGGGVHEGLTAVLYGPWPARDRSAEAAAAVGVDWQWLRTRYNNDTETRPGDSGRYRLRLEPDGTLRIRADCNGAGGTYRLDANGITIAITHSTMAACEPGSLDQVFRRDLAAAAGYFLRGGRLYLDLKHDTGTMELERE